MSARPVRAGVVVVIVAAATWFVARPALAAAPDPTGRRDVTWVAPLREGPFDLAADADGVVVTTSERSLYLLDARGKVRWRAECDDLGIGQPALGAGTVVVGGQGSVSAFRRADGSRRWRVARPASAESVAIAGDTVLVGDASGTLAALDVATGTTRWSVQHPGALWSGARVDVASGAVVATWHQSDAPAVRVLDLATGALRWEAPTDRFTAAPTVHAGRVVLAIGDGDRHARVEARDLRTGDVLWQTPVPASFEEAIEPAADRDGVAVVDHFGVVTLLDPRTGRIRWQHDLADVLVATRVALTGSRVACTSYAGVLHVLARRDGREVERVTPGRLGGLPVAAAPRGSGLLLALRLREWGVQLRRLG